MADATNRPRPKGEDNDSRKVQDVDELQKAAKFGDIERIKNSQLDEIDINAANSKGLTALHIACREGNFKVVAELLRQGAKIGVTTKKSNTPLHVASLGGRLEVVRLLLEHGAEADKQAENDMTSLYMAAQENHLDVAKELLRHKANIHLSASGGFEPVDVAIQQKHSEMTAFLMEQGSKRGFKALHVIARKDATNAAALLLNNGFDPNIPAPNGYTPLHIAAKYGSINTALLLIEASADVNATAKHSITPLHVASKHGQTEIVSVLIEAGAALDIPTKDGLTGLHCAARDGHEDCVELLLVHNASLNAKTRHGLTALHMAAQGDHVNSANHLLGHGCHIDAPTLEGVSPLHVAAHYGNLKIAKLLMDRGADVDKQAENGYAALHVACKKNREDMVQLLIRYGANGHLKNIHGQTALHLASYFGMVKIALVLIENEASIDERTRRDETSLHIACRTKQLMVARLLLRNGAKVDPRSKSFETPLWIACRLGCHEIVSLLLQHGANADARNKDEATYLHVAARNGNEVITECLIDHGAKIDLRNKQQCTPLHEAARRGHTNVARMLIEKNADVNAEAKNNLRPLHISCHYRHSEVSYLLMDHGANLQPTAKNGFTPLHIVAKNNAIDLALHLLSNGVDADTTTKTGISPLHRAAKEGNVEISDALLDNGASPGIQTKNGLTPLHLAARYNQIEVTKKLLKYAAPVNSQTTSGYTPLHFACFYGHEEISRLLLQECADVEAKTRHANTPLHITALTGYPAITEVLLKYNAPTNTLNKDGFTALFIAEITQNTAITELLVKVTHVVVRNREKEAEDNVQLKYSAPEDLEESQLIDLVEESDTESAKERFVVNEDFEESFLGFDETGLAEAGNESSASYKTVEVDVSTSSLIHESSLHEQSTPVQETSPPAIFLPSGDELHLESLSAMEPLVTGGFLVCFVVDARGGIFESKQSGIRATIPRGACSMPTRITCRLLRDRQKVLMPKLYLNEGLVSRIVEISPQGMQFLKPITLEVPHFGSLRRRERELLVLRSDQDSDFWREHVSTRALSEVNDVTGFSEMPTSPEHGIKSGSQFVRIVTQDFPERFAIVARPRKEKFLMFNEASVIKSGVLPKAQVTFKDSTLNISTKISMQVQVMDDSILQPDETAKCSSILRLQPHIKLASAVEVLIPCPWMREEHSTAVSSNPRLLALMPENEEEMSENSQWTWKDVTDVCQLTSVGDCAQFQTSFLTTYWLIEDSPLERIPIKAECIYRRVCLSPFIAKFLVYASVKTSNSAEFRLFCTTGDEAEKALEKQEGFVLVSKSRDFEFYEDQTLHIACNGVMTAGMKGLTMTFKPFRENRLTFKVAAQDSPGPWSYRIRVISSMRPDNEGRVPLLCSLDAVITKKMMRNRSTILTDSRCEVGDDILQAISRNIGSGWKDLASCLQMTDGDIQQVAGLTCVNRDLGKTRVKQDDVTWEMSLSETSNEYTLAALTLLELWRNTKGDGASLNNLTNALKTIGRSDLCEMVRCRSPIKYSTQNSQCRSVEFAENKPEDALELNGISTSEKETSGESVFEFPVSMKIELPSEMRGETKMASNSQPKQAHDIVKMSVLENGVDVEEDVIMERKIEADKKESLLHDLIEDLSGEEEFFDSPGPDEFYVGKDVERDDEQLHTPSKTSEEEMEEAVSISVKDFCKEENVRETVVNDVHCKLSTDNFSFMDENHSMSNGNEKGESIIVEEEIGGPKDENSNVESLQDDPSVSRLSTNGIEADERQDNLMTMFGSEKGVLDFAESVESNGKDVKSVTFV